MNYYHIDYKDGQYVATVYAENGTMLRTGFRADTPTGALNKALAWDASQ